MEIFGTLLILLAGLAIPFALGRVIERVWVAIGVISILPVVIALIGLLGYQQDSHALDSETRGWAGLWLILPVVAGIGWLLGAGACLFGWLTSDTSGRSARPRQPMPPLPTGVAPPSLSARSEAGRSDGPTPHPTG
jgi:hypothetical protein